MFEFRHDTAILHSALLSAQKQIHQGDEDESTESTPATDDGKEDTEEQSKEKAFIKVELPSLCELSGDQMKMVSRLIKSAVSVAKRGTVSSNPDIPCSHVIDMRAHATILYTVLRSAKIACHAADNYYGSVSNMFPAMDWNLYVELLKSCQWGNFFVQCISVLPTDVATLVLAEILLQGHSDFYIKHCVIQATLQRLIRSEQVPRSNDLAEPCPIFHFPFVHNEENKTSNPPSFSDLFYKAVKTPAEPADEEKVLQMYFHALVTTLNIFCESKPQEVVQELHLVLPLVNSIMNCLLKETYTEVIIPLMLKLSRSCIKKELVSDNVNWGTPLAYLVLLIYGRWRELSSHLSSCDISSEKAVIIGIRHIADELFDMLPFHSKKQCDENQFIEALIFIVENKLIGMNDVLEIFVSHPFLLEKEEVIKCLEKNRPQPVKETFRKDLLDIIMKKSVSKNKRLIPIFLNLIKEAPLADQQEILQHFLLKYGLSETLKQINFAKLMSPILNQTVDAEQAEKQIFLLCLQSPRECIFRIIHQAVNGSSGQIPVLVKILKVISSICAYQIPTEASLLVKELQSHFLSNSLITQQLKNMKLLIQELLQVLLETDGLKPAEFLLHCVIPYIKSEQSMESLYFYLQILQMVLSTTLTLKRSSWIYGLNVPALLIVLTQIIELSFTKRIGSLKGEVVSVLNLLNEFLDLETKKKAVDQVPASWIKSFLSSFDPSVSFYVWKIFQKYTSAFLKPDLSSVSLSMTWLYNCVHEERLALRTKQLIAKNLNSSCNVSLICSLLQLLPHLTLQEWQHSFVLLEDCSEYLYCNTKYFPQHRGIGSDETLIMSIGIFVDALLLLTTCQNLSLDWSFMLSTFTIAISNKINSQIENMRPENLTLMFLELCRLASGLEKEQHLELMAVLLLDIFKIMKEVTGDSKTTGGYAAYLYAAVESLPDCVPRSNVLCSLKKSLI